MLSANLAALTCVVGGVVFVITAFTCIVELQKETREDYEQARKLKMVTKISAIVLLICFLCAMWALNLHL